MKYLTCCVESTGPLINAMTEAAVEIDHATMHDEAEDLDEWAVAHSYSPLGSDDGGLLLSSDWHISYWRSSYDGEPCLYLCWSGIEYIWTPSGDSHHGWGYGSQETA